MKYRIEMLISIVSIVILAYSCSKHEINLNQTIDIEIEERPGISQEQIMDFIWIALEPNTSSHKQSNWQLVDAQIVDGNEVGERFEGDPAIGCWSGPMPVINKHIDKNKDYWLVFLTPKPATPMPSFGTPSPTAPPLIPEPFLREAYFLVDLEVSDIVARKLICVIY